MKWLWKAKDGGPESKVWAWGLEIKSLFSILVLKFGEGSREAYHSHAFNAVSWVLHGALAECDIAGGAQLHVEGSRPIVTKRETTHKVYGLFHANWVLSFRGPWANRWAEIVGGRQQTLTYGRQVIA